MSSESTLSTWKLLLAFGILLLIIGGYYGYISYKVQQKQEENKFNGFDFAQAEGGLWVTRIEVGRQPYDIPFYYHPRDTVAITVDPSATTPLRNAPKVVYISVDPDAGAVPVIAGVEISRITGSKYNLLNIETHGALSRQPDKQVNLPVVSCKDATDDLVVIQFVEGKQNVIARTENENCIVLQYTSVNESIRVADRFAYMILGIM